MASRPSTRGSARLSARARTVEESKESLSSSSANSAAERKARAQLEHSASSDDAVTLRSTILSLQTQLVQEQAQLRHFNALRAATLRVMDAEKERKRRLKLRLRDQLADKAELQDSQHFELQLYKHKIKATMHDHTEQLNERAVSHKQAELSADLAHLSEETALREDARALKLQSSEMQMRSAELLNRVKLQHEAQSMRMREAYERQSNQLRAHYSKLLKNSREQMDDGKKKSLTVLESKKNTQTTQLLAQQKRCMDDMKKYYSDITHAQLEHIKALKEEVGDMKKKEASCSTDMRRITRHNERLQQPLADNESTITQLQHRLLEYRQEKEAVEGLREEDRVLAAQMEAVRWEVEVLTQKVDIVRGERDRVRGELVAAQLGQAQASDFGAMVMGRQVGVLRGEVEKAEAGLSEVLLSTGVVGGVGGVVGRGLEDILLEKNRVIVGLEDEVKEWKARFRKMMGEYETEMRAYGIPMEELGFRPVKEI